MIALHVCSLAGRLHSFGVEGILISIKQICSVAVVNIRKFSADVDALDFRIGLFSLCYDIVAKVIKLAFATKKKGSDTSCYKLLHGRAQAK